MSDRFTQVVSTYGPKFMAEFGLDATQAAGILGNLAHETGKFRFYQEVGSGPNSGGRGWPQFTGPRRVAFLNHRKAHHLDPKSDEASYAYMCVELHGAYRSTILALKRCTSLTSAVTTFERLYEGAGVKAMGSRLGYARQALTILHPGHPASVAPAPTRSPQAHRR
jgi:hypothetical protein